MSIASLKDTPRLDPDQPIYYPRKLEAITREQRSLEGIQGFQTFLGRE